MQNKVQQAESRLPDSVTAQGVTVAKAQSDFLLIMTLYDNANKSTSSDVADYLISNMQDTLARVPYALMPSDVETALENQNTQVSSGQIGAQPAGKEQQLVATLRSRSCLQTPEQFRHIMLKTKSAGANALSTAEKVKSTIGELQQGMPAGYTVAYPLDSTEFIKVSIEEV